MVQSIKYLTEKNENLNLIPKTYLKTQTLDPVVWQCWTGSYRQVSGASWTVGLDYLMSFRPTREPDLGRRWGMLNKIH